MTTLSLLLIGSAAFFIAGTIKGFVGLGLPTASLALLTLVIEPRLAISLVLMPMLAANFWQMIRGEPLLTLAKRYWRFAVLLAISVGLTVVFSQSAGDRLLTFLLGVFVLVFVVMSWRDKLPDISPRYLRLVEGTTAIIAGVLGGLTAAWAAPMAMYLSARKVERDEFVQASGFLIIAGSVPLMVGYVGVGHADMTTLGMSCLLVVPTFAGYALGERLRKLTDPTVFKRALLVVFVVMGVNLVWRSLLG